MTAQPRRSLAAVAAVLMLLTAGLIALSATAARPTTDRMLSGTSQHHLTVPSPVRAFGSQPGPSASEFLVLGPSVLLGLGLLALLRRRPQREHRLAAIATRRTARGPPSAG